jgi:hypothetical protein
MVKEMLMSGAGDVWPSALNKTGCAAVVAATRIATCRPRPHGGVATRHGPDIPAVKFDAIPGHSFGHPSLRTLTCRPGMIPAEMARGR